MVTIQFRRGAIAASLAALSLGLGMPLAGAAGGGVQTSGTCSMGAKWTLKAKPDNGRIELEFEVDSNRVGQLWTVEIRDNGALVHKGTSRTVAPSASFTVTKRIANRAGTDVLTARATQATNGQVCSGRLSFTG